MTIPDLSPQGAKARIRRHRTGTMRLVVRTPDGKALVNGAVTVRQIRHRFLFGCNIFGLKAHADAGLETGYQRRFTDLLNYATLPFYWAGYEPAPGETRVRRLTEMAQWCRAHGLTPKGHPLCYHMTVPAWVYERPFAEIKALQLDRITREVAGFAGLVDIWDVINETVFTPGHEGGKHPLARVARKMGRAGLVKATFDRAREANPGAQLIVNDCDPTPAYDRLVRDSLAAGAPIDIVGIQSHMHKGYWGAAKAWSVCERFARHGKPLHFSELTILSGLIQPDHSWSRKRDDWFTTAEGEAQQAQQVEELYRLLFSHPAVHGITWWDFADDNAWLGAPAGLVRKDMSPKPAYDALMRLIKGEWWTGELSLRTDARGEVEFEGFLGDYAVAAGGARAEISLETAGNSSQHVRLAGTR